MEREEIFVPLLTWLIGASRIGGKYNYYTGSRGTDSSLGMLDKKVFNYRIWLEKLDEREILKAAVYYGDKCYECQNEDDVEVKVYEPEPECLSEIKGWIEEKCSSYLDN
ncbi:MAG: hypothetical protein IJW86_02150 [Clostridia bacterium]|nr:hypothetical protein [Clostridia bacterium]